MFIDVTKCLCSLLFLTISLQSHSSPEYLFKDYTEEELQALRSFDGVYSSQDKTSHLKVEFKAVQPHGQLELFKKNKFMFSGNFESKNWSYPSLQFSLDSFEKEEESTYQFSDADTEDDCDDPGCVTYEAFFTFKMNPDESVSANLDVNVVVDAEDLSLIYEENNSLEKEKLVELLNKACQEEYGEEAYLEEYIDDYKNSVYCAYEYSLSLKKISP